MAGLHNTVAAALATKIAGVANVQGCAPTPVDSLNTAPYGVVGPPRGQLVPGSWETVTITYPCRLYVARVSSSDRDQTAVSDFLDLLIAAFRTGIGLGGPPVQQAVITNWNTDAFYTIGGEDYQAIDFTVECLVMQSEAYSS